MIHGLDPRKHLFAMVGIGDFFIIGIVLLSVCPASACPYCG